MNLNTIEEHLTNINKSLNNKLFDEIKEWEEKERFMTKSISFHEEILNIIINSLESFSELYQPTIVENYENETAINKSINLTNNSIEVFKSSLELMKSKIEGNEERLNNNFEKWKPKFLKKLENYQKILLESGGDKGKLEARRREFEGQKNELGDELRIHSLNLEKMSDIIKKRKSFLKQLNEVHEKYYNQRKNKYEELTNISQGKLRLSLNHFSNKKRFKDELTSILKGSRTSAATIQELVNSLMPTDFIEYVLNDDINSLKSKCNLTDSNLKKIIDYMNSLEAIEEVLSLSYKVYPEDIPSIEFCKDDGKYYPLSEVSGGQKSTALLIIALSEGKRPIIIDQPEDSLDNPSVYEDVVSKLRQEKENRQFIVTTHNSSVSVASDSDTFIIIKSSANEGKIKFTGALDLQEVKKEVIMHLEGGIEPYTIKKNKYNIKNR